MVCVCMFVRPFQCSGIPLQSPSGGQIYFLVHCLLLRYQRTIVCWSARVLQVTCRLLAGPGQERFGSPPHLPSLSPFARNWTFKYVRSTAENPRHRGSALPLKPCLDCKRLSVVMSHLFHLGPDEACFNAPQTPQSWPAQQGSPFQQML